MNREAYNQRCRERWGGGALRDALANWEHWEEIRETLQNAMKEFRKNPGLQDLSGRFHNPDYSLSHALWLLQESIAPNRSSLDPLLDFEEHFQKVFLRRGVVIYCTMLLEEMSETAGPERQMTLIEGEVE